MAGQLWVHLPFVLQVLGKQLQLQERKTQVSLNIGHGLWGDGGENHSGSQGGDGKGDDARSQSGARDRTPAHAAENIEAAYMHALSSAASGNKPCY